MKLENMMFNESLRVVHRIISNIDRQRPNKSKRDDDEGKLQTNYKSH